MKRYHADKIAEHPEGCLVIFSDAQTEIARLAALLREGGGIARESIAEARILNGEIAQRDARIAELEAAIDKLAQCKGRFHTEANFKALMAVRNK